MKKTVYFLAALGLGMFLSCTEDEGSENGEQTVEATAISLDKENAVLTVGMKDTLQATVEPSDFTGDIIWQSSSEEVATVDDGVVTALKEGDAVISAIVPSSNATSYLSAECTYIVKPEGILVTEISLDKTELTLEPGLEEQLTVTVLPQDATNPTVIWSSTDQEVVTVTRQGLVTAVAVGEASVTATTTDGSELTATCTITVVEPEPEPVAPRVFYMIHDNYGNNQVYVDGQLYSNSSDIVYDATSDGADIWWYVYNDGFYKENQKILSHNSQDLGDYRFSSMAVRNGNVYALLTLRDPGKNYSNYFVVRTIEIATGNITDVKLNQDPYYNIMNCGNETSICVGSDGKVYVAGTTETSGGYFTSRFWTLTPATGDAEATVQEHVFFTGTSDLKSGCEDVEIGADGSVYTLVSYITDDVKSFVLYKDLQEVRRYDGYASNKAYYPRSISIDGEDVYLMLARAGEKAADIYKNDQLLLSNISDLQSGFIAVDGEGGYYYATTQTGELVSKLYHSQNSLLYNQNALITRLRVAR